MKISDFLNTHAHRIWRDKHLSESRAKINLFISFAGNQELDQVKAVDFIDFDFWLQEERGLKLNTCNHYKAALGALYSHAVEYGVLASDQLPKLGKCHKVKSGRVRTFTPSEIGQIYKFFDNSVLRKRYRKCRGTYIGDDISWMRHYFTIGLNTGMRLGEIKSIEPDSFSTEKGRLYVNLVDTKNGDDRKVSINEDARNALEVLDMDPNSYWLHKQFYAELEEMRRTVFKGDKQVCFHTTRHTYCSALVNDLNVNHFMVMEVMGHRDPKTTSKYVHIDYEKAADINDNMARVYSS